MLVAVFLLVLALLSALLTRQIQRHAVALGVLDVPNERSSHTAVTPRGGGLAIVVVFALGSLLLMWLGWLPQNWVLPILSACTGIALVGWLDDQHHVSALGRLAVQAATAGLVIAAVDAATSVLLVLVLMFLMVALTNFYNFMDGIDGLAASEAVFVSLSAALFLFAEGETGLMLWLLVLAAASAGFLYWNWSPAKIFLGDVGSGFLGFVFGVFALLTVVEGVLSPWVWLILLALFIVDASVTLLRRMLAGKRWYQAHRSHAYQNLSRGMGSHKRVVVAAILINAFWLLPCAGTAYYREEYAVVCTVLAFLPLVVAALLSGAGVEKDPVV